MTQNTITAPRMPTWLLITACLGAAWNVFGLFQLVSAINQTEAGLMMGGMSAQAAKAYYNLPIWMDVAFAVGAGGGLAACVLLVMRKAIAVPISLASLTGYIILFVGDYAYGLFALIPGQLAILSTVVVIAIGVYAMAGFARARGLVS